MGHGLISSCCSCLAFVWLLRPLTSALHGLSWKLLIRLPLSSWTDVCISLLSSSFSRGISSLSRGISSPLLTSPSSLAICALSSSCCLCFASCMGASIGPTEEDRHDGYG